MKRTFLYVFLLVAGPEFLDGQTRISFAVIGDYGKSSQAESDVSNLVRGWNPDLVITTGDNNYEYGEAATIDQNIGQYYHTFIYPYTGSYGAGDSISQFFPSLGNHDWIQAGAVPYLDYFALPGNERYYEFVRGPVHFFAIDSDPHEPDGNTKTSAQAIWLQDKLSQSVSPWNIVYFHHAPYSSGTRHGSSTSMQWPFQAWGVTAVFSGHEHDYERLIEDSLVYFVNGIGGKDLYAFGTPIAGSIVRYNTDFGAQLVVADTDSINFKLINRSGTTVDEYTIYRTPATSIWVNAGWNLLSLPFTPADAGAKRLFPSAVSSAFIYEETGYQAVDTIPPGKGFWLRFGTPEAIKFHEQGVHRDTITLQEGWNLIGTVTDSIVTSSILRLPPELRLSEYFAYGSGYIKTSLLLPGYGYWVKADQSGQLIIGN